MDSMFPCYSLLNIQVIWWNMVSTSPPITMGWLNLKICQNFAVANFFDTFVGGWTSVGGVKNIWGSNIYYYITILSLFHFFKNSQYSETWSVSFKNFFRKSESIGCYLPISSNLQFQFYRRIFKKSL